MDYVHQSATAKMSLDSNSSMALDVRGLSNRKVVELVSLESQDKNKGHATELLELICTDIYKDDLVVLKAEPMFDSLKAYLDCKDLKEKIEVLVCFYKKRGFVSINDYIGYECAVAMCYDNDAYKELRVAIDNE